jgi:16S rRNA (adenine1518-N6/adenine1519-N6)-dimethyltransferase
MPRRLGQHFLADRRVLERIVHALELRGEEAVIEIGAGRGALTDLLAERATRLAAIELDPPLAAHLRERYGGNERVRIIEADVLKVDFPALLGELGAAKARLAGNLPYYITSPILTRLFEAAGLFDLIVVMMQLEVANRVTAKPRSRDYGYLSVVAQYYANPELLFHIPPGAFRPPPKVDSAVVRLRVAPKREELRISDDAAFLRFVSAAFRQKRKTLRNNLKGVFPPDRLALIPATVRAEELSVAELARIFSSAA